MEASSARNVTLFGEHNGAVEETDNQGSEKQSSFDSRISEDDCSNPCCVGLGCSEAGMRGYVCSILYLEGPGWT
jgi:hypothetical protein